MTNPPVSDATGKRFVVTVYDPSLGPFIDWFDSLTQPQQQQLRDKARWEHMTLNAVAKEWGVHD